MTTELQNRGWAARARLRLANVLLVLGLTVVATTVMPAQTYRILHNFRPATGGQPFAPVLVDSTGKVYGTTTYGGVLSCDSTRRGCGTVFKRDKGVETVLHRFSFDDGAWPTGPLLRDAVGNLYGAAPHGGNTAGRCGNYFGCGVVFKIDPTGTYTALYRFKGGRDGLLPYGPLVADSAGNLYGATYIGGDLSCPAPYIDPYGCGTIFKIDNTGKHSVVYRFKGGARDGVFPNGVSLRIDGNLYGTTLQGGVGTVCFDSFPGCGIVFKIDANGKETVLHRFTGVQDGGNPQGNLVRDSTGNLYGVTEIGAFGYGTVFKLNPSATVTTVTTLYNFTGGTDGWGPMNVVGDESGNLYGTAVYGGDLSCNLPFGCGVVFKIDAAGQETVLHTFTSFPDGALPESGVVRDSAGNLYGTAIYGGNQRFDCFGSYNTGCGILFKITP